MAKGGPDLLPVHSVAQQRVRVDWWTAQVVRAMRARGLHPVLLKGPAVARWLYADDPLSRPYVDSDLMVCAAERAGAEAVLSELGFEQPAPSWLRDEPPHAKGWVRRSDGAQVDLHRTLHGCEHVPESAVWDVVSNGTETIDVAGVDVEIPSVGVRALHLALHAIPEFGGLTSQPFIDLERALCVVDRRTWEGAARLAEGLGVDDEMGYRLGLVDRGRGLALELGLQTVAPLRVRAETRALFHLRSLRGLRAKLRYVFQKLFPPPAYLSAVTGIGLGPASLARGYAARLGSIFYRGPRAVVALRRARRGPGR